MSRARPGPRRSLWRRAPPAGSAPPIALPLLIALALLIGIALPVLALPANQSLELKPKQLRFERPPFGEVSTASAALVDDANVASAELLPSGEVLIEARTPGLAQVFIFGKREVEVVRVVVLPRPAAPEGTRPALDRSASPAGGLPRAGATDQQRAACLARSLPGAPIQIPTPACYAVQVERLTRQEAVEAPPAAMPRFVFDLEGLQAEAKAAQALLDQAGLSQVRVALSPFGVKLSGAKDDEEKRRALIALYPAVLGPLRLDE